MDIGSIDPEKASTLVNLPALAQNLNLPGINGDGGSIMCYMTDSGRNKCFTFNGKNNVYCNEEKCFVAYQTYNQNVIGNSKVINDIGLDALMIPDGLSTKILLVGKVDREKLASLEMIVGKVNMKKVVSLPPVYDGLPEPTKKCHVNPFSKDCSAYLSSDDWLWYPGIGFKKRIDVLNDPKIILKSELFPSVKNIGRSMKKIFGGIGTKVKARMKGQDKPMHETVEDGRKLTTGHGEIA